jgi:hypothetical protein
VKSRRSAWIAGFWLLPILAAALHAIPWAVARFETPREGMTSEPIVGYNATDFTQYAAFIRAYAGDPLVVAVPNPFLSTGATTGRFVLPFLQVLGATTRITGLDPYAALELSRLPALFLLFAALSVAARAIGFDVRRRFFLGAFVLAVGGFDAMACLASGVGPLFPWRNVLSENFLPTIGWSGFAALHNPLWVVGLALTLFCVAPVLAERTSSARDVAIVGGCLVLCLLVHPYSGIAASAAIVGIVSGRLAFAPGRRGAAIGAALSLAGAALVFGAVARWQRADDAFRIPNRAFFGSHLVSPFWSPIGAGLVGLAIVRVLRRGAAPRSLVVALASWAAAITFLHSSPVFNGYHFVFQLFLPLALLAAHLAPEDGPAGSAVVFAVTGVFLCVHPVLIVAVGEVRRRPTLATSDAACLSRLDRLPRGVILAPERLSLFIPAYTDHRTLWGHWFLSGGDAERTRARTLLQAAEEGHLDTLDSDAAGRAVRHVVVSSVARTPRPGWSFDAGVEGCRVWSRREAHP